MIGKPEWFTYRIFGWGLRPKTWQGWIYVAVLAFLVGALTAITINDQIKLAAYIIILGLFIADMLHIMSQLSSVHDERENYHQLIIERNCSFAAIAALLGVALFQTYQNRDLLNTAILPFDYSLLVIIAVMVVVKVFSHVYVKRMM